MKVNDIARLVAASADAPSDTIKRIYEWRFDRAMTQVKALFGLAGSVLVAGAAGVIKGDIDPVSVEILILGAFALGFVGLGMYGLAKLAVIDAEYLTASELLAELERISSFLELYRRRA